jgi:hypothetical protein
MLALYLVKLLFAYSVVRFLAEPLIVATGTRGGVTKLGLSAAMKTACCALLLITEVRPAMVLTILLFATASSIIDWEHAPPSTLPRLPYGTAFLLRLVAQFALCAAVAVWWSTSGSMAHMSEVALSTLSSPRPLLLGTGYVIGVFGGSELTRRVVEHFGTQMNQMGRPRDALRELERALRTAPNRFRSLAGAARAASELRDHRLARSYYQKLLALAATADSDRPELTVARQYLAQRP